MRGLYEGKVQLMPLIDEKAWGDIISPSSPTQRTLCAREHHSWHRLFNLEARPHVPTEAPGLARPSSQAEVNNPSPHKVKLPWRLANVKEGIELLSEGSLEDRNRHRPWSRYQPYPPLRSSRP